MLTRRKIKINQQDIIKSWVVIKPSRKIIYKWIHTTISPEELKRITSLKPTEL